MKNIEQFGLFQEDEEIKLNNKDDWGIVYLLRSGLEDLYKIGFTKRDFSERFREMTTSNIQLHKIYAVVVKYPESVENYLHDRFKKYRGGGEWFQLYKKQIEEIMRLMEFFRWMDNGPKLKNES